MSFTDTRTSASAWRAKKSSSTACQIAPKPTAAVVTSTRHAPPRSAGSTSTSRFPEPTTPTSTGCCVPRVRRPPRYSNCKLSIVSSRSPVAEAPRRVVQATGRADEILHRTRRQLVARRMSLVDAQILGPPDDAPVAEVLDRAAVACETDRRVPRDTADRLLALLVAAA